MKTQLRTAHPHPQYKQPEKIPSFFLVIILIQIMALLSSCVEVVIVTDEVLHPNEAQTETPTTAIPSLTATKTVQISKTPSPTPSPSQTNTELSHRSITPSATPSPIPEDQQLTFGIGENIYPSFSPDGEQILFISTRDGNSEIYIMDEDGSNQVRLTNTLDMEDRPSFSPDGSLIVYSRFDENDEEIFVMNREGDVVHNLSNSPYSNDGRASFFRGRFITLNLLFDSDRTGTFEIYRAEFVSDELRNVTRITNRPSYHDRLPSYIQPDGRVLFRSESIQNPKSQLYTIDLDGNDLVQLTKKWWNWYPIISADGEWIIFVSGRSGNSDIFRMKTDGSEVENLSNHPAEENTPAISPDGQWLVFASRRDGGNYHLFRKFIGESTP